MKRRDILWLALGAPALAQAHHGWSSFDQDRPLFLEGRVVRSKWANPHAELVIRIADNFQLPADLAQRPVPAQSSPIDGKALLAKAQLPRRKDKEWEIELAALTRLQAWKMPEIKAGQTVGVLGYTFMDEKGSAVLRAEYVFVDGKAYGLRSSPAA